ncbi:MAG: hypothetical protein IT186_17280 [Acidobacteria bacterium]|nr:hypothetical protein [Acidobacteriota bacterium]MCG3192235.1 hypothetical protein [Thermoanaerobaculia bacterium]
MTRGHEGKRRRRGSGEPGRPLLGMAGIGVLIGTAMLAAASIAPAYRWFHRSDYVRTAVEVMSRPSGPKHSIRVRVVSDGQEYLVPALDFPELHSGGVVVTARATPGDRFDAWYNPDAPRLLDKRLVSAKWHPSLVTGTEALLRLLALLAFLGLGVFLLRASGGKP